MNYADSVTLTCRCSCRTIMQDVGTNYDRYNVQCRKIQFSTARV